MIKLNDHEISILGRPNFACAGAAKILIAGGVYEDKVKKAEYEQAVFIHWALGLYKEHGDTWAEKGKGILLKETNKQIQAAKVITDVGA